MRDVAMKERYTSLDDLWSAWPKETSAILKHIDSNEPSPSKHGWIFNEAFTGNDLKKKHYVVIIHRAYDPDQSSEILLSVQADSEGDELFVRTVKRTRLESNEI